MAPLSFMVASAARDLGRTGAAGLAGLLLSALAVLVTGATVVGLETLGRLTAAWRAELKVVVLLADDAARPDGAKSLLPAIRAVPGVAGLRYISAAEALADLRRYLDRAADGLDRLAVNPLPARIEVTPGPAIDAATLRALIARLRALPGAEHVQAAVGWVEPAERVERAVRRAGLTLGALLGLAASVAIAAGTVTARQRRAEETAMLRLAGVPEARLRGPLILQSVVQGLAGAALGVAALLLVSDGGPPVMAAGLRTALGLASLPAPSWSLAGALLAGGATLGGVGGLGGGRP